MADLTQSRRQFYRLSCNRVGGAMFLVEIGEREQEFA